MQVKLIAKTNICEKELIDQLQNSESEQLVMFCARVSNPSNQTSGDPKLLKYCLDNGHFSIFEMSNFIFEIQTSRAIASQILRHKSFSFQELSQRYAKVNEFELYPARRQDAKNRQNSIDDMSEEDKKWFEEAQVSLTSQSLDLYDEALKRGIAKEQARMLLPLSTKTKLYMNGTLRSWIHYLSVRCDPSTQKEHREIAIAIRSILAQELPNVAKALNWKL